MSVSGGLSKGWALLWGTLIVGTADILDAFVFFGLRGARPIRILQSIASGLLGRAAFSGGLGTALLGAVLHFFIAFLIVATFFVASRYISILRRAPVWSGLMYGVVVYLVMNFVVIPWSRIGPRSGRATVTVVSELLVHMFLIGVPIAWAARKAFAESSQG